jgi:polyhydroxybutyrate depolymerase
MKLSNLLIFGLLLGPKTKAGEHYTILVNGVTREYLLYKPKSLLPGEKYPLLLDFHGGGGNASSMEKNFGFDHIADQKKIIVAYPEGLNKGWNDGRKYGRSLHSANDLAFINLLTDKLIATENADPTQLYAAGISNGAFFSIYLATKLPGKFKAIAVVCGNILEDNKDSFSLPTPTSLLLMNGTGDPIVKYGGGAILSERAGRGRSVSTDYTITAWLMADHISLPATQEKMPDKDINDGCTATRYTYHNEGDSVSVVLIKIENGGHTWPGGKQYLPRFIIGQVCRDFNAEEVIWNFFESQQCGNAGS